MSAFAGDGPAPISVPTTTDILQLSKQFENSRQEVGYFTHKNILYFYL